MQVRITFWLACLGLVLTASWGLPVYAQQTPAAADSARSALPRTVVDLRDVGTREDTIVAYQPQPYRLSRPVLPGTETVRFRGAVLAPAAYRLDGTARRLWLADSIRTVPTDTVFVRYRTFPFALRDVYRRRAPDSLVSDTSAGGITVVETEEEPEDDVGFDPFEGLTLERSGSISRGVVGGTNRDATIESGLRMQLNGEVAEDVFVRATLTDQNTPIQPEGTTQRLDDFDRVFLEIEAPQGIARLGDVDVAFDGSRFGRFTRRLQGASLSSDAVGPGVGIAQGDVTAVGAVSRGLFRTQDVTPIDGVQGPYRLTGQNGEDLIVIIAGSERVFLDGERLERGRTNDYVIDYTRGEIRFTPNRLITDDRRITVEFQYRTTQFTRTLVGADAQAGVWARDDGQPRLTVGATVLREADGDDFQTAFDLSAQDSLRLVESGDDPARRDGAQRVEFDPEAPFVQYRRDVVQTPGGETDTAFVALDEAPPEGTAVFRVRFTDVGTGQGRYARVGRETNGVLYEYRGPGQGRYEPTLPLPKPKRQQLADVTASLRPVRGLRLYGEWAQSENDLNRLSGLDSRDDVDQAFVGGVAVDSLPIEVGSTLLGRVSARVERERRGQNFVTFDQTRPVEFGRKWNLAQAGSGLPAALQDAGDETVDALDATWAFTRATQVSAEAGRFSVGEAYEADLRTARVRLGEPGLPRLDLQAERVTSTDRLSAVDGTFLRQRGVLRQPLASGRVEPRLEVDREQRRQRALGTDSLTQASFAFTEVRPGVQFTGDALTAGASVEYRTEEGPADGDFRNAATAWTTEAEAEWTPNSTYDVRGTAGYRVRRVTEFFRVNQGREDTESILLQLDGGARPLDRAVDARFFYDALTERTPTLQEVYVRTGPEIGQFVWVDSNGDGLQQVDEFVPETTPNEGTYVQSFVPSDSLESVVNVQSRLRVKLDPRQVVSRGAWWRSVVRNVSTQTTVEVREQSRTGDLADVYLLRLGQFRQPGITLDGQLRVNQDVDLLRQNPRFGVDGSWTQVRGLTERAAGSETRFLNGWTGRVRWAPSTAWSTALGGRWETDRSTSEEFSDTRNYDIRTLEATPEASYQASPSVTLTLTPSLARKTDDVQGRDAQVVKVPLAVEWRRAGRFRVTANGEVAQIDLDGSADGLARFELTDGRGAGRSYLWGLQGNYVLNDYLRARVSYDGRAPSGAPTIHTFRAELNATF